MKIAIIGAGAAGLAAIKHSVDQRFECEAFEQTDKVGGTWNYTDLTEFDANGLPVHSSMYKGLRTNIPKEIMEYEDFPYPKDIKRSYINQSEVIEYINNYARHFDLFKHVRFNKYVTKIEPVSPSKWKITVLDAKDKTTSTATYDAVMVCNGHYSDPLIPNIPGKEKFKGRCSHSHTYRTPEPFVGKMVCCLGAGPSGSDIAKLLAAVCDTVFLSHDIQLKATLPSNVKHKPGIKELTENGAIFKDLTEESFDELMFCTGYHYKFPFLTEECGITVVDNWVQPLYKQCININHTTMCFIGIPFNVCAFPMFPIQVRFFLASLSGHFSLPSKDEMLTELKSYMAKRDAEGKPRRHAHKVGQDQRQYFNDLADTAKIKRVPDVVHKLYAYITNDRNLDDCFKIVSDEDYVKVC